MMSNHGIATASISLPSAVLSPRTMTACSNRSDTALIGGTLADINSRVAVADERVVKRAVNSIRRVVEPQSGQGFRASGVAPVSSSKGLLQLPHATVVISTPLSPVF